MLELVPRVVDEGHAARHAGGEVVADIAEDHSDATCHVFDAVRAAAFDDGVSPRVANSEALAGLARGEESAARCAIENGVADDDVVLALEWARYHRAHDNRRAGEAFAHVVVGVAEELELDALHGE